VLEASFVVPDDVAAKMGPVAPVVDRAIAAANAAAPADQSIGIQVIPMMHLANALECTGVPVTAATIATMRRWLPRIGAKRDDAMAHWYWSVGFAALALDDKPTYRRIAGLDTNAPLAVTPGETVGFNLQGLLRHLAGAVEHDAGAAAIAPAWDELIDNFATHWSADSANEGTLLWMARCVYHRIGKHPLGSVAARLRDDLARRASA